MGFCLREKHFCKAFLNWARYPLLVNMKVCKCLKQNTGHDLSGNLPRDVLPIRIAGHPDQLTVLLTHSTHRMVKPSKTSPTLESCVKTLIWLPVEQKSFPIHLSGSLTACLLISSQKEYPQTKIFLSMVKEETYECFRMSNLHIKDQQYTPNFKHYWIPNLLCVNGDVWLRCCWKAIPYFSISIWLGTTSQLWTF